MKSPKDMRVIMIDITNACIHACANCTRMCGHHEKTFMMDFDTFKRAVDSMEGYGGTVGLIGGEPTLHPEFERFAEYMRGKYAHLYEENTDEYMYHPLNDFMKSIQDLGLAHTERMDTPCGALGAVPSPGLFSAMGSTYLKHYETIQDTFKRQGLNDHTNDMFHQPALVSRKDLGIPDEKWLELRENCWLQNNWSASITPKGAFFCEIAGCLDMLFDGPGGWPLEKGWWKREPDQFSDQLHWCEMCGFACETFTRNAQDPVDDVSASLVKKLEEVRSPKAKSGKINVIKVEDGVIAEESKASDFTYQSLDLSTGAPYIKYISEKFNAEKSVLFPENFVGLYHITSDLSLEIMQKKMDRAKAFYKKVYAICDNQTVLHDWETVSNDPTFEVNNYTLSEKSYGHILNQILKQVTIKDYIISSCGDVDVSQEFLQTFRKSTPNPGSLLYWDGKTKSPWVTEGHGFVGVFNGSALSLREMGFDQRALFSTFEDMINQWQKRKIIPLDERVFAGSLKDVIKEGERCVIFGSGGRSSDIYFLIAQQNAKCVAIVDSNPKNQGVVFEDLIVTSPESLREIQGEVDRVLQGSPIFFEEIKEKLMEMGFPAEKISQI